MPTEIRTEYAPTSASRQGTFKALWWKEPEEETFKHVLGLCNTIQQAQDYRRTAYLRFAQLYANVDMAGFGPGQYARASGTKPKNMHNRVTLNVIKSCVDTAAAKIAKNKPQPEFSPMGANFKVRRRAQKLTKYVTGVFDTANVYEIAQSVFVDACVFGTGFMRVFEEDGAIRFERVFPDEILVDDCEAIYGEPRSIYQTRLVSRERLSELFPDFADKIRSAQRSEYGDAHFSTAEMIEVIECWHLPSKKGATDGKHAIIISNATLFAEAYERDTFPFVSLRWTKPLRGFYGVGLAEELQGLQSEINKLLRTIQQAQHLVGVPRVWVEKNSGVTLGNITNDIGAVIQYQGTPPIFATVPSLAPDIYQHLNDLYGKAYEISGISQLSANAQKPAGLNSGAALREYNDQASERFAITSQAWEKFFLDAARIVIDISREIAAGNVDNDSDEKESKGKALRVKVKGKRFVESITWSDVDLDEDQYMMRLFSVAELPSTPAGRLQFVQELLQGGLIEGTPRALRMLNIPDTEEFFSSQTAGLDDVEMLIERILDGKDYEPPDRYMDLKYAQEAGQSSLLRARMDGAPDHVLENLMRFVDDAVELMKVAEPPPAPPMPGMDPSMMPPGPGGPGGPVGTPAAPPVSDLLASGAPLAA